MVKPQMDANERKKDSQDDFWYKDEVYKIVGTAFDVLKTVGHGFHEKIYEEAMMYGLFLEEIAVEKQKRFAIIYKDKVLGEYVPDLIAYGSIVIEIKTIDKITDHERGQLINYLKISGLKLGLLLNFKKSKLEWERIVLSRE
jgi:GxxExxY protein